MFLTVSGHLLSIYYGFSIYFISKTVRGTNTQTFVVNQIKLKREDIKKYLNNQLK